MPKTQTIKKSALTPTVLIADGAGFIGSHLADALLAQNARVIVVDNLNSPGKEIHVDSLLKNKNFALFNADINKGLPSEIESVDYIFQLSGIESYLYSENLGLDSLLANSLGTKNLLDFAKKSEAKYLLVSSTDIYQGMVSSIDLEHYFGQTEKDERKYSLIEAKRYAEALVWEYYKKFELDVRIARIPKIYGPRMDLNNGEDLSYAVKSLLDDNDLVLYGEGTEKNYYLYVSDAIAGMVRSLFNENTCGKIYSFAPEEPYSTLEVIYLLKSLAHREINIDFKPKLRNAPSKAVKPDTTNTAELDWSPKVEFKDGVKKTLNWFGYEVNEHSFKPNKLVEDKKLAKVQEQTGSIVSVADETPKEAKPKKEGFLEKLKKNFELPNLKLLKPRGKKQETPKINAEKAEKKAVVEESAKVAAPSKVKKPINSSQKVPRGYWYAGTIAVVVAAVLLFLVMPFVQAYSYANKGREYLEKVPDSLTSLDTENAKTNANSAFKNFHKAETSLRRVSWVFSVSGRKEQYQSIQGTISSAKHFSKAAYYSAKAVDPFTSIWTVIRPDSDLILDKDKIAESNLYLSSSRKELQLAKAQMKKVDASKLPKGYGEKLNEYNALLDMSSAATELAVELSKDLPNILGVDSPKRYLVLLQNSNEIRPNGGFIGSYAVLEIDDGKITELKIDDIYNPDGQIDVQDIIVEAPPEIEEFFEEDRLYIRNANWNVEFTETAKVIQDLFYQIDGSRFDGVIAIDVHFAEDLLNVTGPLFLTAYNKEVTSDTLYETTQFESEFNFKGGSNQKRSFLTVMGSKLLEKLVSLPREKTPHLLSTMISNLNSRHMMIYFNNSSFNAVLDKYGWSGDLVETEGDYVYVVNANVGGTKANYFVDNIMEYGVTSQTRDGVLRSKLILNYKHNGTDFAWPGGVYKNYVRILTPKGTRLTSAKLNDSSSDEQEFDLMESIVIGAEGPYTSYETLVTVQPSSEAQLIVEYDLPAKFNSSKDQNTYSLYWQKQPGTKGDEAVFSFSSPFGQNIKNTAPAMDFDANFVKYKTILDTDTEFRIEY